MILLKFTYDYSYINRYYYIQLVDEIEYRVIEDFDDTICEILKLKIEQYHKIAYKCGAYKGYSNIFFKNKEDIERFIEKIENYVVMKRLSGE